MYKNSFVHYLTKVLVDIMFYGGIIGCIALPFIMPALAGFLGYSPYIVIPYTVILILSGLCALSLLWQLKAIFRTLLGGNPFTAPNVSCLRKCSVASFLIAVIFLLKICFWFTIASSLIVIIFSLLGLFCLTLKDVFKQAVAYKEENDWTV
ncbi:MAG: DUF2975 domain-containing protein [Oscillospiraceae bacterium]|nr:DUF2975 domain-containing protein [Oscillospiraceae bacterium]